MKTTLNAIRAHGPCEFGWRKLLTYLGKTRADDDPLSIATVLDSNGLNDALWCLRAVEGRDREIRLYTVWCARQVQHLMRDERSLRALDVAEAFANGLATEDEARAAAYAASAAYAAYAASASSAASAAYAAYAAYAASAAYAAYAASADARAARAARAAQKARLRELIAECEAQDASAEVAK